MKSFVAILLACFLSAGAGVAPTSRAASPSLVDLSGVERRPLDVSGKVGAVIVFVRTDCPISNAYAPEFQRLVEGYSSKGVSFYLVYAVKDLPVAEAREHAKQYGFNCPAMIDRQHALVKALGATVTPEAFVVGADGRIVYRGRIDDLFVGLGRQKHVATTHELRDAVEAVAAGKDPGVTRTKAVGCAISDD